MYRISIHMHADTDKYAEKENNSSQQTTDYKIKIGGKRKNEHEK